MDWPTRLTLKTPPTDLWKFNCSADPFGWFERSVLAANVELSLFNLMSLPLSHAEGHQSTATCVLMRSHGNLHLRSPLYPQVSQHGSDCEMNIKGYAADSMQNKHLFATIGVQFIV